jgi:FtsP/CotA-like multicopper oxidase with cupredoxin domain
MDGGPHQVIEPGATWSPYWTVDQGAATCWYHPHLHGTTARHVYRGVAGLFIVDDEGTLGLELPNRYGVDDIPLVVQDKAFATNGALIEDARTEAPSLGPTFGILGRRLLVNGTYDPFVEIATTRARFRILNASNARMYHLGFSDRRRFHVIATDAGLLPAPVAEDRIQLSPAERAEIVVEFQAGEQVVLHSFAGDNQIDSDAFDVLKVVVAKQPTPSPPVPQRLSLTPPIQPSAGARVRRFTLSGSAKINARAWTCRASTRSCRPAPARSGRSTTSCTRTASTSTRWRSGFWT